MTEQHSTHSQEILARALEAHDAGLAVVPIKPDGQKRPAVAWAAYQDAPPTREQVVQWFTTHDTDGLGVVTGAGSGGLEMVEVEGRALDLVTELATLMADNGLADLWDRLNKGWVEATPSGGIHWHYRVTDGPAARNTKLARRPATADELAQNPGDKVKVLVETRGQGGFTVIAPSAGRTHPTGRPWVTLTGGPTTIPALTVDERDSLFIVAGALDSMPAPDPLPASPSSQPTDGSLRPGDDYNARATWDEILTPRGWTKAKRLGRDAYGWTRPGKEARDGISATTNTRDGADRLYVFSTSTEFEAERPYSKFSAYALLEHNGDHSAAARALRAAGYGTPPPAISAPAPAAQAARPTLTVVDGTSARVVEPDQPDRVAQAYGPTEDGTARALAHLHADRLRYCPQRGSWLTWTGSRWEWDQRETHRELVRAIARALPEDDGWKSYKKRALSATGVTGIARLAQSDPAFTVHIDELDANPYELNTPGGIVDLRTGELRPADPAGLHTRSTAVAPDMDRPGEAWETFLHATFGGDEAFIAYIRRLVGLSAIGRVKERILPFAYGSGANGKSTLAEAAMYTLGHGEDGYAISAPSEMLMVRRHSEHPAELAQLAGARLVVCSELEDGARFAEARIKQLTGGDSINARFMRRDPFTFKPSHTIWLLGNHKPEATVGGPAFWTRLALVPFDHVVPEGQRDPRLGEKLEAEAPAILAWIARGAAEYEKVRLSTPATVTAATQSYAHDQDTVGRFVDERCHMVGSVTVKELREAYEQWCYEEGSQPVSARRLTQELRDRFQVSPARDRSARRYDGIALQVDHDDHDGDRGGW